MNSEIIKILATFHDKRILFWKQMNLLWLQISKWARAFVGTVDPLLKCKERYKERQVYDFMIFFVLVSSSPNRLKWYIYFYQ